jgi:hypothetical protein
MKGSRNGRAVGSEAIGCDLESRTCGRTADAFHEDIRGGLIAFPQCDIQNQFCISFNCYECISVAKVLIIFGPNALLLFSDQSPEFVAIYIPHLLFVLTALQQFAELLLHGLALKAMLRELCRLRMLAISAPVRIFHSGLMIAE